MVIPPADLEAPEEVESETKETTEQPTAPSVKIPVIDIQMPLPTAEVVTTATYAAVAAVATTTLATPFFDQIKKKLTKFLQGKINKWKEKRKKKKDSSES
jgi:sortase (surface protein transpeptidase)